MPDLLIPPLCWIVQTSAYFAELKRNPADDGTFKVGDIVTPLPLCLYFKAGWICPGFMTGFFLGKSKVNLWSCTMSVSPLRISFWVDIPTWASQVQPTSSQGHWVVSLKGAVAMSTKDWRSSSSVCRHHDYDDFCSLAESRTPCRAVVWLLQWYKISKYKELINI